MTTSSHWPGARDGPRGYRPGAMKNVITPVLAARKDSPTEATLTIFGEIGPSEGWFGPTGMFDTQMVSDELDKLGGGIERLTVLLNSGGGDAYQPPSAIGTLPSWLGQSQPPKDPETPYAI